MNEHGARLRACDYVVCFDSIEQRVRRYAGRAPIVSPQWFADIRVANHPYLPDSSALAAWCAWMMGCAPIVLCGIDLYGGQGGVYWHSREAESRGAGVSVAEHLNRWRRVALVGAGGGAAAVIAAAERWAGCRVSLWSRDAERSARLTARFGNVQRAPSLEAAVVDADLVVNATPLGLGPDDEFPVPVHLLPLRACVFDLAYVRAETAWVRAARAAGRPAADGLGMLIAQGALAFERWFGEAPDREAMWASVRG